MGPSAARSGSSKPRPAFRRRRTREETKALILDTATRSAIERTQPGASGQYNLLASIRISDVLDEINAQADGDSSFVPLTTGAAYHIWPDQAAFQFELLEHVMQQISTPGAGAIERQAFEMVADGVPADQVLRMVCDADFEATLGSPELFLALGLGALAPAELVRQSQEGANAEYLAATEHLLTTLLRYAKLQIRPPWSIEDLIWATEALTVGYLLRWRTHPEVPTAGEDRGETARAAAFLGLVHAFTQPIEDD